jgi:DNA-binding response OmpR family regulator
MKILFIGKRDARVENIVIALRMRWTDIESAFVDSLELALKTVEESQPQIIFLCEGPQAADIHEAVRTVRAATDVPMIVVGAHQVEPSSRTVSCLEAGADDYLAPGTDMVVIMARCVAILRRASIGGNKLPDGPIICGTLRIVPQTYEAYINSVQVDLTPTEFKLLCVLAQNRGAILSRDSIKKVLWINDFYCADTLKKYVQRLRRKLGDDAKNPTWIKTVHGVGYMLAA